MTGGKTRNVPEKKENVLLTKGGTARGSPGMIMVPKRRNEKINEGIISSLIQNQVSSDRVGK